jgi:hypothetical protein
VRFGITRDVQVCPPAGLVERSNAIAQLFADEIDDARHKGGENGPVAILADERYVQSMPLKLAALFLPYLTDLFERRQLAEISAFEQTSLGARLVSAHGARADPAQRLRRGQRERGDRQVPRPAHGLVAPVPVRLELRRRVQGSAGGHHAHQYVESAGRFDQALRQLFVRPRGEVAMALARLHSRLLQCQVSPEDGDGLRDNIIIPALSEALARGASEAIDDLLGLLR